MPAGRVCSFEPGHLSQGLVSILLESLHEYLDKVEGGDRAIPILPL
jgi:hypothetical protein